MRTPNAKFKIICFFLFLMAVFIFLGWICYRLYWASPAESSPVVSFEVNKGQKLAEIVRNLQKYGLLDNPHLFKWYLKKEKLDKKIQTGIFELRPDLSVQSLVKILTNPEAAEIKLTFLEGWNLRDFGHYLENQGLFQAEEWQELVGYPTLDYRFSQNIKVPGDFSQKFKIFDSKPKFVSWEGYLFPDTYRFKKNVTAPEMAEALLKNFGEKISLYTVEINNQRKSLNEIVIVASLIEAEAKIKTDRRLISDIIWRRLAIGMPLQLDSTVNYVTDGKKPAISLSEQAIDSPYNTYKYAGLPLGPINNPGLESILAAIYPEKNDYWFFLTDKDGQMHYAKTLQEHNQNIHRGL